jgi:Rad3-related DNA helicase
MRLDLKSDDDTTGDKRSFDNPTKSNQGEFDVLFPYDRIYPEQHQYLKCIKRALHKNGHALIEAPPGTNQSLCLLSSLTSYQQQQQQQQNESTATTTPTTTKQR